MNQNQPKDRTEQIWGELSDRLRQFVRSRIASTTDVDDVLQTVFLRIHSHVNDLRNEDRLESWVFQITRNAVTDHFRKQRDAQNDIESLMEESDNADAENFNPELVECLGMFIKRLPDNQQRALVMYELDGVAQKDIAIRESISVSGAKSRIQRGRKSLERMLKTCCEFQFDSRGNVLEHKTIDTDCCANACG